MAEGKSLVYTLGDFQHRLSESIAADNAEGVNMQSDQALELLNECLPRNLMLKRIFQEKREGESIIDTLPLRGSGKDFIITNHDERGK